MASESCLKLLMSHTQFARLNATDQRDRLIKYYSDWFEPGFTVPPIDNIRATQRLTTFARLMNTPVGAIMLTLLEEASRAEDRGTNSTLVGEPEAEPEEVPPGALYPVQADPLEPPARESEAFYRERLESVSDSGRPESNTQEPTPEPEQPAPPAPVPARTRSRSRSRQG